MKLVKDSLRKKEHCRKQKEEGLPLVGKQASLIVFPKDKGTKDDFEGLNGNSGFREAFNIVKRDGKTTYQYKEHCKGFLRRYPFENDKNMCIENRNLK